MLIFIIFGNNVNWYLTDPNILSEERQQFLDSDNFRPADPNRNGYCELAYIIS